MNLKNLKTQDANFRKFMLNKLDVLVKVTWDQTTYKMFYGSRFFADRWDKLPTEFNWKPYWGDYSNAKIIHFHGPKPFQKSALVSEAPLEELKTLLPLVKGKYLDLEKIWQDFLPKKIKQIF